jgi:hypothetical protein
LQRLPQPLGSGRLLAAAVLSFVSTIARAVLAAHLLARLALEAVLQQALVLASVPQIVLVLVLVLELVLVLVLGSVRQPVSVSASVLALRDNLVKVSQQQPRVVPSWLAKPGALGRWQTSLSQLCAQVASVATS